VKPRPESGKRGPRDKDIEAGCIACTKGKRKGIPPKARWKEELKEKAQGLRELQNEESGSGTRDSGTPHRQRATRNGRKSFWVQGRPSLYPCRGVTSPSPSPSRD
jgi:hypothetical protein